MVYSFRSFFFPMDSMKERKMIMKMKKTAALLLALMTLSVPSSVPAADAEEVWMYAVSVGKADAILLGVGEHAVLVDAGYDYSWGRIQAALKERNVSRLEAVFLTHLDKDHCGGLMPLAQSAVPVDAWYASAMNTGLKSKEKHPMIQAAALRGQTVSFLQAGDTVPLGGALLRVLSPLRLFEDKDDNNSLVLMLESAQGKILLTGDIEFPAEQALLASGADLKCDILKVANHADDDTTSPAFVLAASPRAAVISTSSVEKPETPDPRVLRLLEAQNTSVYVTQECTGGILLRLRAGEVSAERVNVPEPAAGVALTDVIPGEDLITLENRGDAAADLSGWYLYSARGSEMFFFPEGTELSPGETLTVGTKTSKGNSYDLFWDDKKVIHAKKEDSVFLYDACGSVVSVLSNGLKD